MLAATSRGAFDMLPLKRGWLYPLVIGGTLALAVLTFVSLTALYRPTWNVRLLLGWQVYLVPLLTLVVAASSLNPGLGARLPLGALRWIWIALAGLALLGGLVQIGSRGIRTASGHVRGVVHRLGSDSTLRAEHLAKVNALDPADGLFELIGFSTHFYADEVRAAALARARQHPDLVAAAKGAFQHAQPLQVLEFLRQVDLSDEERRQLAAPARDAIFALADLTHRELRYTPRDRLKFTRNYGGETCHAVATRFAGCGVDFAPALDAFTRAFTPDET